MAQANNAGKPGKLTPEEFVLRALDKLRDPKYKGIHSVYSGFNQAFREYFKEEGLDPIVAVNAAAEAGKVKVRPCKGGAKIYKPEEIDGDCIISAKSALNKMNL